MARLITDLNKVQEDIVKQFIDCGGRGFVKQLGRGQGYTTALAYLAMQQAALTKRKVWMFVDYPVHVLHGTIQSVREGMMRGVTFSHYNGRRGEFYLRGNLLRVCQISTADRDIRGHTVDDAFIEINESTSWKYQEFFHTLRTCNTRDGKGFDFTVAR